MTARRTRSTTSRRRSRTTATQRRTPEAQLTGAFNKVVNEHPAWAAVILVVVAIAAWLYIRHTESDPQTSPRSAPFSSSQAAAPTPSGTHPSSSAGTASGTRTRTSTAPSRSAAPASGLPSIAESALPGKAQEVLAAIRAGGPFEFSEDGAVFGNFEGMLPKKKRGYYREYTVKLPTDQTRGAHRLVTGFGGEVYWTDDHYESFSVVEEGT